MLVIQDGEVREGPIPEVGLGSLRKIVRDYIDQYADIVRKTLFEAFAPTEAAFWSLRLQRAQNFQANGTIHAMLQAEADAAGITVNSMANRIITKNSDVELKEMQVSGTALKHRIAVNNLPTIAEVAAYDWRGSWPTV